MAQASAQVAARTKIPRQPECNVGTTGHVDHGKCLALDEYILFNGRLSTGREIASTLTSGRLLKTVDGGLFYQLDESKVLSVGGDFTPVESESQFYLQRYSGPMYSVTTNSGRSVSVTPEHPLLVNRRGAVQWVKAREIRDGDYVAFVATIPAGAQTYAPADPIPELARSYRIVTFADYEHLRWATDDFARLSALGGPDFDKLRILAKWSRSRLGRKAHIGLRDLSAILEGRSNPTRGHLARLSQSFKRARMHSLSPGEYFLEAKTRGVWSLARIRDANLDADMMKWFAFVWAEGTSTRASLSVSQSVQMEMLADLLRITRRKFGLRFRRVGDIDYRLSCKALVDYLHAKFSFVPGNERASSIAPWVLSTPAEFRAAFLRWFFTLDGEFNELSGQIMISQANERNTVTLGYLLQMFGIIPRFSKTEHTTQKGPKSYSRLTVSGRRNLLLFSELIGFEDKRIQHRLLHYLSLIKKESKETNFSLPLDAELLDTLLRTSGLIRESFRTSGLVPAKESAWYKAYSDARRTGRMSRSKLLLVLDGVEQRLRELEPFATSVRRVQEDMVKAMWLSRMSLEQTASLMKFSRKRLTRLIRTGSKNQLAPLAKVVRETVQARLSRSRSLLSQLKLLARAPLEFDRVRAVQVKDYDDYIFDLTVPGYANFIAGNGGIVCHNTTITQSITGVWASAHSEELKRGITIKVGYADAAFYKCPHTPAPAAYSTSPVCPVCSKETQLLRCISFVDCPGHESLMTNMLAGAALMDGAILVIAANEPVPRPQTSEHLQALQMLGMKKIVVVQNKIDLIDDEAAKKNYEAIANFISNTVAADAPIIPISAQHNINIDALIEAIEQRIPTPKRDPSANALMYVLRSFDVNKPGEDISSLVGGVVGGSLVRGEFRVGDEIEILPGLLDEKGKYSPISAKIESLGTGAGMAQKVGPGGLVAVGTQLDPSVVKADQMVGSLVGKPGTLPPVWTHIKLDLQLFDRAVGSAELVKVEKVKKDEALRLNMGTASVPATVTTARDTAAELELKKPVAAEPNSRVAVSRRIAERWRLIGSGVIK